MNNVEKIFIHRDLKSLGLTKTNEIDTLLFVLGLLQASFTYKKIITLNIFDFKKEELFKNLTSEEIFNLIQNLFNKLSGMKITITKTKQKESKDFVLFKKITFLKKQDEIKTHINDDFIYLIDVPIIM